MIKLFVSLLIGGLIVLLASSNAHVVETRLGPLVMASPHFVVLGVTFMLGVAIGIFSVLLSVINRRKQKTPGRAIVIKR
ncbi:magnetosome protein MamL [Magnetospirillum sp. UT-4]|uniref:magnetosome protein MamL n=1 Tax=Magnetospirillum sp. UT-4 TaxID=2681467 RepID=UPI001380A7D9|nr:magnetosome protein MamL [Magnetospirillum sp. UT-4]CAA7622265.1 conserved exported hypothetical protein [Magnetospirillum sp. UT-4]